MKKAPSWQIRGRLREVHDPGGSLDIHGSQAVAAIDSTARNLRPFVKAFSLAHASETGAQDQPDTQEAARP